MRSDPEVIAAGHDRAAAGFVHRRRDRLRIGRHHHGTDLGGFGLSQHVNDHRQPGDVGERLAGQAGRSHPGRDQDKDVGHRVSRRDRKAFSHRFNGLPGPPQTGYLCAAVGSGGVRPLCFCFLPARSRSMDSFELNKVLGAVLGTCLFVLALNIAAGAMFSAPKPAKPTLRCRSILRAAGMQPRRRRSRSRSCWRTPRRARRDRGQEMPGLPHVQQGEPNRVGPNLYGVVGRDRASVPGFNYSAAMKAKAGKWTIEELNAFLINPRGSIRAPR